MWTGLVAVVAAIWFAWSFIRRRLRRTLCESDAVLVTGCDSGFGYKIVKTLVEETAAAVFAGYVTEDGRERLSALGPRVTAVRMDVTKNSDVEAAVAAVGSSGKRLHGVVNNAGIGVYGWCEELPMERYETNVQINLLGAIRVTKLVLPLLRQSKGRLVSMGSVGGRAASAFGSAYVPTKAALASFQDCVRQEVFRFGIKCSLVEPGFFATGMLHRAASTGAEDIAQKRSETTGTDFATIYGESSADKMKRTEQAVKQAEALNGGEQGVRHVIDAVMHALTGTFPRTRYLCGVDANVLGRVLPLIPDWIIDIIQTYLV